MDTLNEIFTQMKTESGGIEKFRVLKIGIFGSFARGEQSDTSDVDVLVEFEEGQETFDNYMGLKFFLEDLFERKVDLVIASTIKESLKKSIMESVKYAKGA